MVTRVPRSRSRFDLVKAHNEQQILDAIISNGHPISRVEIAKVTGLTKPTVNLISAKLEAIGLILSAGTTIGEKGRSAALYRFNPQAEIVMAIDIGVEMTRVAIADLLGQIIVEREFTTSQDDVKDMVTALQNITREMFKVAKLKVQKPAIVVIGLPGVIAPGETQIMLGPNIPALKSINFTGEVRRIFSDGLRFEHDINLAALGEFASGVTKGIDDFAFFFLDKGVGMGLVINGELVTGYSGYAGEIGFLPFGGDPFTQKISGRGILEERITTKQLLRSVNELRSTHKSNLKKSASVDDVIELGDNGDSLARAALDTLAEPIALAVLTVTAILNPKAIVFGGSLGLSKYLRESVQRKINPVLPFHTEIMQSALGKRATLIGAISIALTEARSKLRTV